MLRRKDFVSFQLFITKLPTVTCITFTCWTLPPHAAYAQLAASKEHEGNFKTQPQASVINIIITVIISLPFLPKFTHVATIRQILQLPRLSSLRTIYNNCKNLTLCAF